MRKVIASILFVVALAIGAQAQTQDQQLPKLGGEEKFEFVEKPSGFRIAEGVDKQGDRVLLVIFPEKYLTTGEAFNEGSQKLAAEIFGCNSFTECPPKISGTDRQDGMSYIYFMTTDKPAIKVKMRGLGEEVNGEVKIRGVVVSIEEIKL